MTRWICLKGIFKRLFNQALDFNLPTHLYGVLPVPFPASNLGVRRRSTEVHEFDDNLLDITKSLLEYVGRLCRRFSG